MNKPEINQEVYEQYVDATVALFMEHYSAMLTEKISSEENADNQPFPETLDLKCKALIKKEASKQKRLTIWKYTKRTMKAAAVFAIAVLTTFSMLFVSVDAFRIRVVNFYIEHGDDYWAIAGNKALHKGESTFVPNFDVNDPLKGLIPKDYRLINTSIIDSQTLSATYENSKGDRLRFATVPYNGLVKIDTEDADLVRELQILGNDAMLATKAGSAQITWGDKEAGIMYLITADNEKEAVVVSIAEKFIKEIKK